jgi:hypothetical protein
MRTTCTIIYQDANGKLRRWTIGASEGIDDDVSLAAHLANWRPAALYVTHRWRPLRGPRGFSNPATFVRDVRM